MGVNSLPWYYLPSIGIEGGTATLEGEEWHHCFHVMRMKQGDHTVLCNGQGLCMEGRITNARSKEGQIELIRDISDHFIPPRNYKVIIGIAPTKNMDRTEFAIEKLVELGVDEVYFLDCDHNERSHLRMDRMQKMVVSAAKQSRKISFPILHELIKPAKMMETKKTENASTQILACHLDPNTLSVSENYLRHQDVVLMIGPEGGFSTKEIEDMTSKNVKFTHLGPFRLRVETAAIVACASIHLINQSNTA